MKLWLKREQFLKAFSRAAAIAPARHYKDVLTNVLLTAGSDSCLEATDLEVSIRIKLTAAEMAIENGDGKVLLPGALFRSMLGECSDEMLKLSVDGKGAATLAGQWAKHQLQTVKLGEFPTVEGIETKEATATQCQIIEAGIKSVAQCAGDCEKWNTNCVFLEASPRGFCMVATEGHVFGVFQSAFDEEAREPHAAMIPPKAAKAIAAAISGCDGDATIGLSSNWIRIDAGGSAVMARLLEGRFPKWRVVIQKIATYPPAISMPAGVLKSAIRQASLTNQSQFENKMTLEFSKEALALSAGSECGKSTVEIPVQFDRPDLKLLVNWKYMMACLSGFPNDSDIEIKTNGPEDPVFLKRGSLFYMVQPMSQERN